MKESELILNPDGSIYHLAIQPGEIGDIVIFVGDQDRVQLVSRHFDRIEIKKQKREFFTHTGWLGNKRISVMSTGIGTDNVDIVLNELDALVNIDFTSRQINSSLKSLILIRIGTSGAIHPDVNLDDIVISKYAIGLDVLGQYYGVQQKSLPQLPPWSYLTKAYDFDMSLFPSDTSDGITLTCPGFYNPQSRVLRINSGYQPSIEQLSSIQIDGTFITNIEMETAGIYLLANLLGHKAISFNAILAQRLHGTFSKNPEKIIEKMIRDVMKWISILPG